MKRRQQVVREGRFRRLLTPTRCESMLPFAPTANHGISLSLLVPEARKSCARRHWNDGRPIRVGLVLYEHLVGQQADGGQHEHGNSPPN